MILVTSRTSHTALDVLKPVLNGNSISSDLIPQIESAYQKINKLLSPIPADRLSQVIARLMWHYPEQVQDSRTKNQNYFLLKDYPEDLVCACYHHTLKRCTADSPPSVADMMVFMQPEMEYRQSCRQKLESLMLQLHARVSA